MATAPAFGLSLVWESNMVTQVRDENQIEEFATGVGEWLVTQRFGSVRPLAFRYYLWEPAPDSDDEPPHVVIELTVEDPPPPPKDWRSLPVEEAAKVVLWLQEDMDAAEKAARAFAIQLGVPSELRPLWPVSLRLLARSEVEGDGRLPLDA